MDTLSGEVILSNSFLFHFEKGSLKKKDFLTLRANSSHLEEASFRKVLCAGKQTGKQ